MSKKSKKTIFKEMRWEYMVFAVIASILGILIVAVPSIMETINKAVPDLSNSLGGVDVKNYILVSLVFSALVDLLYFYLITRCADGKSKGTFLLILLVLRVLTAIVAVFTTKTSISLDAMMDAVTLFYFIRFKNESK